jgi:hypothetical protein
VTHFGHTDTTKPAQLHGTDALLGFSSGGYSGYGDIIGAVYDDARDNNSMFGLHQMFFDMYEANAKTAFDLAGEDIPGLAAIGFKDVARSLAAGEELGMHEISVQLGTGFVQYETSQYTVDLDAVNEGLKKLQATHPEIQTFEEMYAAVQAQAQATEQRAAGLLARADMGGDMVGFLAGFAGAFNKNDPVNIGSLGLGGWGSKASLRILSEMGIGAAAETINQVLGVHENRQLLGLDNSVWRSAQMILFAAGGAGLVRGGFEGAPMFGKFVERRVAPQRAFARELLSALEEVGVPVRSPEFLQQLSPYFTRTELTSPSVVRAARHALDGEIEFRESNPLGPHPVAMEEHHARIRQAADDMRAADADMLNGVEAPRTSIFDDMGLRGEYHGVDVAEVGRVMDEASADLDIEIAAKNENIGRLEDDIARIDEKIATRETKPFSDFLREMSPQKADALAQIEQQKALPGLGKTRRRRLAKAEEEIRNSPEGKQAAAARESDVASGAREKQIQRKKIQAEQKAVRALDLKRDRVREQAHKAIDTEPRLIRNRALERAADENVKLTDVAAMRIPGIPNRGGMSPSTHVEVTHARLTETDPHLNRTTDEAVARVEQSFDEVDGTVDIGATRRVSADMMVTLDDGTSMSLRQHLDDIAENERLVEAVRSCPI